jgi:phosphinothricin acetyltransferase
VNAARQSSPAGPLTAGDSPSRSPRHDELGPASRPTVATTSAPTATAPSSTAPAETAPSPAAPAEAAPVDSPAVSIRLARLEDSEAIRAIYNVEVETSTVTMDLRARTMDEQRHWLGARSGAHAVVVAVVEDGNGERVAGFASLSPWRSRPGYSTTVEDSVYVDRSQQGLGLGRRLLGELLAVARAHGFHAVMARIASGHEASLALHRRFGFELVGTEREVARKFGRWIDIDVLQLLL